jgi:hypothetical protein
MLRSVGWLRTDVSGLSIGPVFKDQLSGLSKVSVARDFNTTVNVLEFLDWLGNCKLQIMVF